MGTDALECHGRAVGRQHDLRGPGHACFIARHLQRILILGDDIIGQALRCVRGIEVDDETLAVDQIRTVCIGGDGHYLGADQTLERIQSEHVYPAMSDRTSPKEWDERGKVDLIPRATPRKEAILSTPSPARFNPILDSEIRARFPIRLTF